MYWTGDYIKALFSNADLSMQTAHLGGTAKDVVIAKTGHGLMMMTWRVPVTPDDQCFEAIKAGIDALPPGAKMFLNSGEFYANDLKTGNLELLARFYEAYPGYAERTFLSVKGGLKLGKLEPDGSPDNLRRSVDAINSALRGTKRLDLFEPARVDSKQPLERVVSTLAELVKEGKFDHVGLSECKAETLAKANKIHPIAAVEIEVSPWAYEEETKKVIVTAGELGIPVIAYSPLGRGFLTGQITDKSQLQDGDIRKGMTRFQEENMKHNMSLVDALKRVAESKGVTPAQLSLAWVSALGPHVIPLPGSSKASRTLENLKGGSVTLTEAEKAEVDKALAANAVKGGRAIDSIPAEALHLWG